MSEIPEECATDAERAGDGNALRVSLELADKRVPSHDRAVVVVVFTNVSKRDTTMVFTPGCAVFVVEAYARGQRADILDPKCDYQPGCANTSAVRIVLEPGGTLKKTTTFETVARRPSSSSEYCEDEPLRAGKYELRVVPPPYFLQYSVEPLSHPVEQAVLAARITLEVGPGP